jgi:hypothetical protein
MGKVRVWEMSEAVAADLAEAAQRRRLFLNILTDDNRIDQVAGENEDAERKGKACKWQCLRREEKSPEGMAARRKFGNGWSVEFFQPAPPTGRYLSLSGEWIRLSPTHSSHVGPRYCPG